MYRPKKKRYRDFDTVEAGRISWTACCCQKLARLLAPGVGVSRQDSKCESAMSFFTWPAHQFYPGFITVVYASFSVQSFAFVAY